MQLAWNVLFTLALLQCDFTRNRFFFFSSRARIWQLSEWLTPKKWFWKYWFCANQPMLAITRLNSGKAARHRPRVPSSSKLSLSTARTDELKVTSWAWLYIGLERKRDTFIIRQETQISLQRFVGGSAHAAKRVLTGQTVQTSRINAVLTFHHGSIAQADIFMSFGVSPGCYKAQWLPEVDRR